MLTRTSLLAFTAAAVVGLAAAVAPTVASAKGGHHGGHNGHHGGHNSFKMSHHHHKHRHHVVRWHRDYRIVRPVTTYATYTRPVVPSCTCLTKTYLDNGAVLFQDSCTKESAINPPEQQTMVK